MLRVREDNSLASAGDETSFPTEAQAPRSMRASRPARLAALTAVGLALGAGGAITTVSLVQAGDDAGVREFLLQEGANRRVRQAPQQAYYASTQPVAYAPPARTWQMPLFRTRDDGRIPHPTVELNPFKPRDAFADPAAQPRKAARPRVAAVNLDTVSGAADVARTICVRLCDGFQAPLGYLRSGSDMKSHEALCQAMNPGIPVKVFKVAAGADTIDDAQAADGKRYGALPVAYSYQNSADPACRPAIVKAGERRVSLLRDFTLRPGDSVVLDGKVRTFSGSAQYPYSARDFRDFRSSAELSKGQRQQIDERVGISRMEAQATILRRQMRLREASLHDDNLASDAFVLRGPIEPGVRGPVRVIPIASAAK
jgi:hypothetical protein